MIKSKNISIQYTHCCVQHSTQKSIFVMFNCTYIALSFPIFYLYSYSVLGILCIHYLPLTYCCSLLAEHTHKYTKNSNGNKLKETRSSTQNNFKLYNYTKVRNEKKLKRDEEMGIHGMKERNRMSFHMMTIMMMVL